MNEHNQVRVRDLTATSPRVVLVGDGPTALSALRSLVGSCRVVAVLRSADDDASDPIHTCASTHGIDPQRLTGVSDLSSLISKLMPDAVVISSFSRLLPPDLLSLSRFINVHYSLLPRYRGRANVNWAIINGEGAAGISIHLVTPALDDGNILFQGEVPIMPTDTAHSLYERLNVIQERELGLAVVRAVSGDAGVPQDPAQATYGCGRVPDDGEIDWSRSTEEIDRLIRALSPPFPPAYTYLECRRLSVVRAEPRKSPSRYEGRVPGRVVGRSRRDGWVDALTGDGILRLFEVGTAPGARTSPAAEIIGSTRNTLGLSRSDLLRRIEMLEQRLASLERRSTLELATAGQKHQPATT